MNRQQAYVDKVYQAARAIGLSDVAARVAAAQSALETGYGKSAPGNAAFGIKAGKSWQGKTQNLKTWEEVGGKRVNIVDRFRAYDDVRDSLKDWRDTVASRWPGVLTAKTFDDGIAALNAGKRGGYATDSQYGNKLSYINNNFGSGLVYVDAVPTPAPRALDLPTESTFTFPARPQSVAAAPPVGSAPLGSVQRQDLPSIPAPSSLSPVAAYRQLADTATQAGVAGLSGNLTFDPLQGVQNAPPLDPVPVGSVRRNDLPALPPTAPAITQQQFDDRFGPSPAPAVQPMASAMDVWSGKAQTGRATNGDIISVNPNGGFTRQSAKYGYTESLDPSGKPMGGFFGLGIPNAPKSVFSGIGGRFGDNIAAKAPSVIGGLLGGMVGGPLGSIAGSAIGSRFSSNRGPNSFPAAPSPANAPSKTAEKGEARTLAEALGWGDRDKSASKSRSGGGLY